jgi:NADH-quinone oxidoreductase subunit A
MPAQPYYWNYFPLLLQILVAVGMGAGMVGASWLIGKHRKSKVKLSAYECGIVPEGDARGRFSVKFYMVAMLFILFDVEAVFIYPWAIILRDLKHFGLWEMLVYIGIFLVGFFYVWKKGVLDWGAADSKRGNF